MTAVITKDLEQLRAEIARAISEFDDNIGVITEKAINEGGSKFARKVLNEYHALKDARWEIDRAIFDDSNSKYDSLMKEANRLADEATKNVKSLKDIKKVVSTVADLISALGRILIVLAK
jgi:hypothetical protein